MSVFHSGTYALEAAFLSFLALLANPGLVFADDPPPPSLALPADPGPPIPRIAMTVDLASVALEDYGAQLEVAPWPAFSVRVAPFWRRSAGRAIGLDLALRLRPWADGVAGPFLGLVTVLSAGRRAERRGALGAELGWSGVYGRLLVGFSVGVVRWLGAGQRARGGPPVAPRVVLAFGTAI